MKKFILAVVAGSVALTPAIAAAAPAQQQRQVTRNVVTYGPDRIVQRTVVRHHGPNRAAQRNIVRQRIQAERRWARGQRFDRRYARDYRQIDYRSYRQRGLYAPPRGHHWVRSGNDAVLVAITTGIIASVLANAIR